MKKTVSEPKVSVQSPELAASPLGQVLLYQTIQEGHGVQPPFPLRVYPDYAFILITRGRGRYRDASGMDLPVETGDAILVLPGLAHHYGPSPGTVWDEAILIFRGPAFGAWQEIGLLSLQRPITRLPLGREWAREMRAVYQYAPEYAEPLRQSLRVCRLLAFLTEAFLLESLDSHEPAAQHSRAWAADACRLLANPQTPRQPIGAVAAALGMSVETFRRHFRAQFGESPQRWRTRRHLEAACHWIQYTQMTNAAMADRLGFVDEFHFSRRFKQVLGETPTEFRKRLRPTV